MANTGFTLPGTAANNADAGSAAWVTPNDALADDSNVTTSSYGDFSDTSQYLHLTNFGFSLPAGAVIDGIVVRVKRREVAAADNVCDHTIQLIVGGSRVGDNKADTATEWPTTTTNKDYGSSSDKWGLTPTKAEVEASNFGIAIRAGNLTGGTSSSAGVEVAWIDVYYTSTQALTATLVTGVATVHTATVGRGTVGVTVPLFTDASVFFTPIVTSVKNLLPDLFLGSASIYTPEVTNYLGDLTASLVTNAAVIPTHTVSATYSLVVPLLSNSNTTFAPVITYQNNLIPGLFLNTNGIFPLQVRLQVATTNIYYVPPFVRTFTVPEGRVRTNLLPAESSRTYILPALSRSREVH